MDWWGVYNKRPTTLLDVKMDIAIKFWNEITLLPQPP